MRTVAKPFLDLTAEDLMSREIHVIPHTLSLREAAALLLKHQIGGAPVTQRFASEIGADGFSDNASGAVRLARQLLAA